MAVLEDTIKRLLIKNTPDSILQCIKKAHYLRTLKKITEEKEPDLSVIRYLVAPGDSVVDIGANIGIYTKYLSALVGTKGRVVSIEPVSFTFDILKSNFKKLHIQNIDFINAAMSDTEGQAIMEVPLYKSGGENFYEAHIVALKTTRSLRRLEVKTKTLDSLFSRLPERLSFIKCDVEGHEFECIKGALGVINASKPAWLIEISQNPDEATTKAYQVFSLLKSLGYSAFWFDGKKLNKRNSGDRSINYFFLMEKHLTILQNNSLI